MVENSRMKKNTTDLVPVQVRVPKRLHAIMLKIKRTEGRSINVQVIDSLKQTHEADGKAART